MFFNILNFQSLKLILKYYFDFLKIHEFFLIQITYKLNLLKNYFSFAQFLKFQENLYTKYFLFIKMHFIFKY